MRSVRTQTTSWQKLAWALAALALGVFVLPSDAFPPGRGRGRGGAGGPKGDGPSQPGDSGSFSGSGQFGKVIKFKPAEGEDAEKSVGVLTFKPRGKDSKNVNLNVIRDPEPVLQVPDAGNYRFDLEQLPEVIWKGLYLDASWIVADPTEKGKANAKKNLAGISLTAIEIEGVVKEIRDDAIILKAKPKGDRLWPDQEDKELSAQTGAPPRQQKPKTAPARELTLKVFDGMTRYADSSNKSLDSGDFQANQNVEAKIVYGKPGIMVVLIDPNSKSGTDEKPTGRPKVAPPGS